MIISTWHIKYFWKVNIKPVSIHLCLFEMYMGEMSFIADLNVEYINNSSTRTCSHTSAVLRYCVVLFKTVYLSQEYVRMIHFILKHTPNVNVHCHSRGLMI